MRYSKFFKNSNQPEKSMLFNALKNSFV